MHSIGGAAIWTWNFICPAKDKTRAKIKMVIGGQS
jgi:hypothetical protein